MDGLSLPRLIDEHLAVAREHASGLTVTELAALLGVGRPVVYRLVATLEARDFVTRREDGRIRLNDRVADYIPGSTRAISPSGRPKRTWSDNRPLQP